MLDLLVANARVMTCDGEGPDPLGLLDDAAVGVRDGVIAWVGPVASAPAARQRVDAGGQLLTPGLVDCHTHAIFAGDRAHEFALRARGASYLEIAAAGGGIAATLGPTRAASDAELIALLSERLVTLRAGGTTTLEVKSGYDLTVAGELRLLRCIAAAARAPLAPRIVPTLLAHLVPPERRGDRDAFVRELCEELVPAVARERLATSVDVYCDDGAFTLAESRAILEAARAAGLAVRGHVGQFADLGAAHLLAELGALSGDHLEQIDDAGIAALARAGIVAVMLPGAFRGVDGIRGIVVRRCGGRGFITACPGENHRRFRARYSAALRGSLCEMSRPGKAEGRAAAGCEGGSDEGWRRRESVRAGEERGEPSHSSRSGAR